jgi:hypothetical protein
MYEEFMSIKLALLKSGEEVIADIKEIVNEEETIVSLLFSNPYVVKLITPQILVEELSESPEMEYKVSFSSWLPLSLEKDIVVRTDWVVSIVEPVEMVKKSYEEKFNGRGNDGLADGRTGGGNGNSSIDLNESISFNQ